MSLSESLLDGFEETWSGSSVFYQTAKPKDQSVGEEKEGNEVELLTR